MKIKNKKKFILSNLILFSILLLLFSVSKISLSKTIVQYTDIYILKKEILYGKLLNFNKKTTTIIKIKRYEK